MNPCSLVPNLAERKAGEGKTRTGGCGWGRDERRPAGLAVSGSEHGETLDPETPNHPLLRFFLHGQRKRCQKKTRPPWMITQAPLPPPATPGPGRGPLPRPPHLRPPNSALSGPASEAEDWGTPLSPGIWGPEVPPATSGGALSATFSGNWTEERKGNPGLGIFITKEWERGHRHGPGTIQTTGSSPLDLRPLRTTREGDVRTPSCPPAGP